MLDRQKVAQIYAYIPLVGIFATSDLGSLNSAHFGDPSGRGLNLPHSADLVAGVARNPNVVTTLKSELDVANLELLRTALLGVLASSLQNLIDEVVGDV